ncbi:hypothetical protein Tco_1465757 [Tanacetum coccineum]
MAAGSKDRPPMLGPGRYSQWRSRFLRYIDTKPNGGGLKKSILSGPYVPTTVQVQVVEAAEGRPAVPQHTSVETILNMTPENKEHFQSEKEAIFLLLTGIGDEIYSTVDACNTANEMWIALESIHQGETLNVRVKTHLFLGNLEVYFSEDGDSTELYYKSRFTNDDCVDKEHLASYNNTSGILFDILKQFQLEVNDIRAERIAKSANPLALIAAAQPYSDNYYQAPKPQDQCNIIPSTRPKGQGKCKKNLALLASISEALPTYQQHTSFELFKTPRNKTEVPTPKGTRMKEIDEQELEAHYSYMAKIQEVSLKNPVLLVDSKCCVECVDERDALANLIANLTLDTEENKTILKQLKKANASLTQELEKCKTNLDETNSALGEAISCRDSCLIATSEQTEWF